MVSVEVEAALAWLHIFSAIAWMGTAMFMAMVLGPATAELLPPSRQDLIMRVFPRFILYVTIFATLTLVFGVLLAYETTATDPSMLNASNPWSLRIMVGALLALAAYILAMAVGLRSARRILGVVATARASGQAVDTSQIARLSRRMRLTATTVVVLLAITLVFMVAAARL